MNQGLVYVFTGEGKGKTSAALGTAIRALCAGMSVSWIAFYKSKKWNISEFGLPELLVPSIKDKFHMYILGEGFYIKQGGKVIPGQGQNNDIKVASLINDAKVIDTAQEDEHRLAAQAGVVKANELNGVEDVLVLDEVNNAVNDGLIDEIDILELIWHRGKTHLILTGRFAHKVVIEMADLVTEMEKIKHPYDTGKLAIRGLDF